ncbi:facilitated trehalose transporter Tret1-like [Periplaneta americana]|uniref:facilitated trehalose transporter Tret1-like n=1 Tax=Periplaneta americana TaxID=6978 RepID=UPI0037E7186B
MAELQEQVTTISRCRLLTPQVLASLACSLLLLDLSVSFSFTTVVIGQLKNSTGPLALDDGKASWIGSIAYICQPLGAVSSGVLTDLMGRKRVMLLINLPFLLGWVLMATASSFAMLCIALVLLGITAGLIEAPLSTYIGEVCQPSIRGVMSCMSSVMYQLGSLLVLLTGTLTDWRTTAVICTSIPVVTAVCLLLVPEAPIWLISKGRIKDAEKALCWLRGWEHGSAVLQELSEMVSYHDSRGISSMVRCTQQYGAQADHRNPEFARVQGTAEPSAFVNPSFVDDNNEPVTDTIVRVDSDTRSGLIQRAKEMGRPTTRRPLLLLVPFMFFTAWSGYVAVKPFMIQVFTEFQMPVSADWATVIQQVGGLMGAVVLAAGIRRIGKRPLSLVGSLVTGLCTLLLGVYALVELEAAKKEDRALWLPWAPLLLFAIMSFFYSSFGMVPWVLLSELFPFRTRGFCTGVCSASHYVFVFAASKTFLLLEGGLQLYGTFWLYCAVNVTCFIVMYFQLPETEGRTLQDIERHFSKANTCSTDC